MPTSPQLMINAGIGGQHITLLLAACVAARQVQQAHQNL
jgi:hypothetical protein